MLWQVAEKIEPVLKNVYQKIIQQPVPNLRGDRDLEYSWVAANMPQGPGKVMDFGCGLSWLGLLAARKGFAVTALDLTEIQWFYKYPNLNFLRGDIFNLKFPVEHFDLIINCSAIEHVGLSGRYEIAEELPDGDLKAMSIMRKLLKRNSKMILTLPVGRDKVYPSLHKVYGPQRLPRLLDNFEVAVKEYWVKDDSNKWISTDEATAINKESLSHCYGLGLFVLRPA